ncbi:hypothetical protein [Candidatus Lokiarchaeum ossiferum]|uniref:hypothetical protein n=1 Tax=Candidatus Lokiarchaeum ossiferum TaxID=2951803 RepID=UPI00352E22CA
MEKKNPIDQNLPDEINENGNNQDNVDLSKDIASTLLYVSGKILECVSDENPIRKIELLANQFSRKGNKYFDSLMG